MQVEAANALGGKAQGVNEVGGKPVVPREVFHALFSPLVFNPEARDVAVIQVVASGTKGGRQAKATVSLVDRYDEDTGFRAMERLTGGHAAITAALIAQGKIPPGAHPVEKAVPPKEFIDGARKRGMVVKESV